MRFVYGYDQVADSIEDSPTDKALYKPLVFYQEETERVGQIIKFDPYREDGYHVSCFEPGKRIEYFRVLWNPLFRRFEAVRRI